MAEVIGRKIPVFLCGAIGFFILFAWFIDIPIAKDLSTIIGNWAYVFFYFAVLYGTCHLVKSKISHIQKKTPGEWIFSVITLASFLITIVLGWGYLYGGFNLQPVYDLLVAQFYVNTKTVVYSLLACYTISAAYRAFRVRNVDASILLVISVLVMLGNMTLGEAVWEGFPVIGHWILSVPATASNRALEMTVAIGMVVLTLRTLIGLEKGYLGRRE